MKRTLISVFALFLAVTVFAQDNTLLWKISGKGLKKESYLFGTLHMACGEDFRMEDKVKVAAGKVEGLVLEVDLENPNNLATIQNLMKPDPDFFKDFDPKKKALIDSVMKSKSLPVEIFDQAPPVVVLSLLTMQSFACSDPTNIKMMEMELKKLAELKDKPVAELETPEFQINLLNNLFHAEDLYNYLKDSDSQVAATKKLVAAYFSENIKDIEKLSEEMDYLSPEGHDKLLKERNNAWMEKLPTLLKEKPLLVAVGAAHLVGEKGLIKLLKKQGYKVTPVLD
ncbi:TraB/GumN family protein [Sphingobacterium kyonggiense]|uniref:TraB/GumN family protein n=1 Tax=Sphingobacterium kyonggiense TaxID=714075 RepID=A0ABP7YHY3_9SPHI